MPVRSPTAQGKDAGAAAAAANKPYAVNDLSPRTDLFRSCLIDEFQLFDDMMGTSSTQAPTYTSRDFMGTPPNAHLTRQIPQSFVKSWRRIPTSSSSSSRSSARCSSKNA
jgi:hypothetical protein